MQALEQKIKNEGKVLSGNVLKVNGFLNHLVDVPFLMEMGREVAQKFKEAKITKILTVEASGIAFATCIANFLNVPVLFAKKHKTSNLSAQNLYQAEIYSYTHQVLNYVVIEKDFLSSSDVCLIADDFLASGNAVFGLKNIIGQANATLAGVAIAVEKGFQEGGKLLRDSGVEVFSLAIIEKMSPDGGIEFRAQ